MQLKLVVVEFRLTFSFLTHDLLALLLFEGFLRLSMSFRPLHSNSLDKINASPIVFNVTSGCRVGL